MDRVQAPQTVGPNLRYILFENKHQSLLNTACVAWGDFNYEDIEILSILKTVQYLWEGTVQGV